MDYTLRFVDQLRPHLKALRKRRGLTQAQAGGLVGVSQARIAEIEANPGAVSFEQLMKLLAALGASMSLRDEDAATDAGTQPVDALRNHALHPVNAPPPTVQEKSVDYRSGRSQSQAAEDTGPAADTPRKRFVVGPKKGAW